MLLKHLIIGVTGASGSIYAQRILKILAQKQDIKSHLIISPAAKIAINYELDCAVKDFSKLGDFIYKYNDIAASLASGSFKTMGMIIAPCSINTMSQIATGNTSNLLSRAADVVLKEKRRLIICLRETPLHSLHLDNLKKLADLGAIIFPPVPAFYLKPKTIDDIVNPTVGKMLDMFDIENEHSAVWQGIN